MKKIIPSLLCAYIIVLTTTPAQQTIRSIKYIQGIPFPTDWYAETERERREDLRQASTEAQQQLALIAHADQRTLLAEIIGSLTALPQRVNPTRLQLPTRTVNHQQDGKQDNH